MKYFSTLAVLVFAAISQAAVNVGDKPTLNFTSVTGQSVNLSNLKGKIVIVDFWATWCGPCMQEAPHMVAVNEKYKDKGLQIIGISLDQTAADAANGARDHNFNWPQACDAKVWQSDYASAWGVDSIPRTFIIGPDGAVLWTGHPALMDQPLAAAFKDHPPQLVDPQVLADANTTLDQVSQAMQSESPEKAISLLRQMNTDAMKDDAVAKWVNNAQEKLRDAGEKMLSEVQPLIDSQQYLAAMTKLQDVAKAFFGSPTGTKAQDKLAELMKNPACKAALDKANREAAASKLLTAAQNLQTQKKDMDAYLHFKEIVSSFPGTDAADAAAKAAAVYEQDPEFVKKAKDAAVADKANALIQLAGAYQKSGRLDLAEAKLQTVIDTYPDTSFAVTASQMLEQIKTSAPAN